MSSPSPSVSTVPPSSLTPTNDLDIFTRLFLLFIFLSLFIRVCYVYISIRRDIWTHHHGDGNDQNNLSGLPISIINSYHTFPYGKTNGATTCAHDTTCSICISDYEESEMLRMMPQCRHYFHRDCVDKWLKVNASCPVCRNSLVESSNK
ncbi:RING-H2 finger protein ATL67 [Spatholobus suberectus]|nr:RING-H2 finger protein ATL67 [Spatholobus suberectus]